MEVRMASKMLNTARSTGKHCLVCIDELFHSTNPPDAEISAKLFLQQVWNVPNVKSLISTHIFSLCELNSGPQQFCVPATESDGNIKYSYKFSPGTCTLSSVQEVLQEYGMIERLNASGKSQ
jgi:DNA mismatch repair ATPase MutS